MSDIDFLPAEYWKRRQSQRDQWYLLAIGLASLFLLITSFVHETEKRAHLRALANSLEAEHAAALKHVDEVEQLRKELAPLAFDARLYGLLRARPSLSRAMTAIATSCPSRLSLVTVRVRSVRLNRTAVVGQPPPARGQVPPGSGSGPDPLIELLERFTVERETNRLSFELAGVADSDLDVAELMERLESAETFKEVYLSTVDDEAAGVSELREFSIQCRLAEVL